MKSESILRWREVALAIFLPLCLAAGGRYAWMRMEESAATKQSRLVEAEAGAALKSDITVALQLSAKGNYGAAEPILRRALATREKKLGPEHRDTLASMSHLANLLRKKREFAEAGALFRRVLETRERLLGPEHEDTLHAVGVLAACLRDQGNIAGAQPLFRRCLQGRERTLGPAHPDTLSVASELAVLPQ